MVWSLRDDPLKPAHCLFAGATGYGKSTRMEQEIHKIIQAGLGCAVFSPTPEMIDSILVRLSDEDLQRTYIVDPLNPHHAVGINILKLVKPAITDEDAVAFASTFLLDVIRDTFGEESLQVRGGGMLKEFLGLMLLGQKHLAESYLAWDPADEGLAYRDSLYGPARDMNPFYEAYIARNIDVLPVANRQSMLEASLNKLKPLFDFPGLTCTLLQPSPSLDLEKLIDQDAILLVDLSSMYLGADGTRILGGFLLAAIYQTAICLNGKKSRQGRCWQVFLDEFAEYCSERILLGLAQSRKLGLLFSLGCQDAETSERRFPHAWGTIVTNCTRKYVFKLTDERTRDSLISDLWGYNPKLKDSIGDWNQQRQIHAANLGALQRGQYFFQDGSLTESASPINGQAIQFLNARMENTAGEEGACVKLPPIRNTDRPVDEQAIILRDQLALLRSGQKPRSEVYRQICQIYVLAATESAQKAEQFSSKKRENRISGANGSNQETKPPLPGIGKEEG
jgi:TraM recognition site of TraD and TraG